MNKNDYIDAAIIAIESGLPDYDVNFRSALALGWDTKEDAWCRPRWTKGKKYIKGGRPPQYTSSLDAIVNEIPKGWYYIIDSINKCASIGLGGEYLGWIDEQAETANRALLLALLKAISEC